MRQLKLISTLTMLFFTTTVFCAKDSFAEDMVIEEIEESDEIDGIELEDECELEYGEEIEDPDSINTVGANDDTTGMIDDSGLENLGYLKMHRNLLDGVDASLIHCMHAVHTNSDGTKTSKKVYFKTNTSDSKIYYYIYGLEENLGYDLEFYDYYHRYLGSKHVALSYSGYIAQVGEYKYNITAQSDSINIKCTLKENNPTGANISRYLCYEIFDSNGNKLDTVGHKSGELTTTFSQPKNSATGEFVFDCTPYVALEMGDTYKINVWIQLEGPTKRIYENTRFLEASFDVMTKSTPDVDAAHIQDPVCTYDTTKVNGTYPSGKLFVRFPLSDDRRFSRRVYNKLYLWDSENANSEQWDYEIYSSSDSLTNVAYFNVDKMLHAGNYKYKAVIGGVVKTGYLTAPASDTYPNAAYGLGCDVSDVTGVFGTEITYKLTGDRAGVHYLYAYYYTTDENSNDEEVGKYNSLLSSPIRISAENDYTAVINTKNYTSLTPGAEYRIKLLLQKSATSYPSWFEKVSYYTIKTKKASPIVEFYKKDTGNYIKVTVPGLVENIDNASASSIAVYINKEDDDFYEYCDSHSLNIYGLGCRDDIFLNYVPEEGKEYSLGIGRPPKTSFGGKRNEEDFYTYVKFNADSFRNGVISGGENADPVDAEPTGNNQAVIDAAKSGKGAVDDTVTVTSGKKQMLSINDDNGYGGKITTMKGNKLYISEEISKGSFKSSDSKIVTITAKGVLSAKKEGTADISYVNGAGVKRLITVVVISPEIYSPVNATVKKSSALVKPDTSFELKVKLPVNATCQIKKGKLTSLDVSYDDTGNFIISGKTGQKGSGSVIFTLGNKKYTVKIKVSKK